MFGLGLTVALPPTNSTSALALRQSLSIHPLEAATTAEARRRLPLARRRLLPVVGTAPPCTGSAVAKGGPERPAAPQGHARPQTRTTLSACDLEQPVVPSMIIRGKIREVEHVSWKGNRSLGRICRRPQLSALPTSLRIVHSVSDRARRCYQCTYMMLSVGVPVKQLTKSILIDSSGFRNFQDNFFFFPGK